MDECSLIRVARMNPITRGKVIDVNLDPVRGSEAGKIRPCVIVTNNTYNARVPVIQVVPLTECSVRKAAVITNVAIIPSAKNGLTKKSVADCLQTRPIDHRVRLVKVRGKLEDEVMEKIDDALKVVFAGVKKQPQQELFSGGSI
jgi:mRNA interferase MazF